VSLSLKAVLALAALAALGAVAAAIVVGSRTFEGTVVSDPYGSATHFDEARHRAEALGWTLSLEAAPLRVGEQEIRFSLLGKDGAPLDGADARVTASRPGTARQDRAAAVRPEGAGRFAARLAFPEPGIWDVEIRAARGADRLDFHRRVQVER